MSDAGDYCPDCGRLLVFSWPVGEVPPADAETFNPLSSPTCWTRSNGQLVRAPAARVGVLPPIVAQEPPPLLELSREE
jgi:hypothetical protein